MVHIFYGHLVNFAAKWFILWTFVRFCGDLVKFFPFWYVAPRKIWQPCFFVLFRKQHVRLEPTIEGEQRIRPVVKTQTGSLRSGPEAAVSGGLPAEVSQPQSDHNFRPMVDILLWVFLFRMQK
jgi:hypothetical protein